MNEVEAKTKWCPFTRVGEQASGAAENRPDGSYNCLGSGCMSWRKTGEAKCENRHGKLVDRDIDGTGRWHYDGYCGLAGPLRQS